MKIRYAKVLLNAATLLWLALTPIAHAQASGSPNALNLHANGSVVFATAVQPDGKTIIAVNSPPCLVSHAVVSCGSMPTARSTTPLIPTPTATSVPSPCRLMVPRSAVSSNANLSNIALSTGTLTPAFASLTTAYSSTATTELAKPTVTILTPLANADRAIGAATAPLSSKPYTLIFPTISPQLTGIIPKYFRKATATRR